MPELASEAPVIPLGDPRRSQKGWTAPPTISFIDWDKAAQIAAAVRGLENKSDFSAAAILADATMRDPRINGVLSTRAGALMGTALYFQPATERRKAQRIRDEVAGSDEFGTGLWEQMFPPAIQGELSLWGNMLGIGVAEIVWTTTNDRWIPRLIPWHPQHLRWNESEQRFYIRTADDTLLPLPRVDQQPRSDGRWVVWAPHSLVNGWRRALLRALAMLYVIRQWAARDWSRYNEKHGMPTDIVKSPPGASEADRATVMGAVANRGAEAAVELPQGDTEQGSWGVSVLEPVGRSWDSFKAQIEKTDVDIAIAVLGQNLSTEVQGGSFAAAQVHEMVRIDKRREDAGLARCLRDQVLTWWALYNYGDAELAPRMAYEVDPPADEMAMAGVLEKVGVAVAALQGTGADVDVDAIMDLYAVPMHPKSEEDEDAISVPAGASSLTPTAEAAIMTVNEARARKGLAPLTTSTGEPDPDGNLTVAEFIAKRASVIGAAAAATAGDTEAAANAPPATDDTVATLRLVLDDASLVTLKSKPRTKRQTAAAAARAQKYALRVAANAREKARAALKGDVAEILGAVRGADSLEEVKRRVVAKYRGLKGNDLARVIEKANLLAQMAGRTSALEDL